jgi:hypothetical protein
MAPWIIAWRPRRATLLLVCHHTSPATPRCRRWSATALWMVCSGRCMGVSGRRQIALHGGIAERRIGQHPERVPVGVHD